MTNCLHRCWSIGWPGREADTEPVGPLLELVPRSAPPEGLLRRIEREIDGLPPARAEPRRKTNWDLALAALGGAVASASLAAVLVLGGPAPVPDPLMLADASGTSMLGIEAGPRMLRLDSPRTRPEGALELWLVPGGSGTPVSLGLVASKHEVTLLPLAMPLAAGDVLALSEEPVGGSPAAGPTGPIVASVVVPRM